MSDSKAILGKAWEIVSAYGRHFHDPNSSSSKPLEDGSLPPPGVLRPTSSLPYKPWEIRWAIMTFLMFEISEHDDELPMLDSLARSWPFLETYVYDHVIDRVTRDLGSHDQVERTQAKKFIDTIFDRYLTSSESDFDVMLYEIAPALYEKRDKHLMEVLRNLKSGN